MSEQYIIEMALFLGVIIILVTLIHQQYKGKATETSTNKSTKRRYPPLRSLIRFADFFGLPTRKAIQAMAGDYDAEVRRLRREKRAFAARWNIGLAWGYAIWFVGRAPIDWIIKFAIKSFRGTN